MKYSARFFMIGAAFCLVLLICAGVLLASSISRLVDNGDRRTRNYQVLVELEQTLSAVQDAETGERGYIITGDDQYLEPYRSALPVLDQRLNDLRTLLDGDAQQQQNLDTLTPLIHQRIDKLQQGVDLRRTQGFQAILDSVQNGGPTGKQIMDHIRVIITNMENITRNQVNVAEEAVGQATQATSTVASITSLFGSSFLLVALIRLNLELQRHQKTELGLRDARSTLELRVLERTAQLAAVNDQQRFLSEASRAMVLSLDYRVTLQRVADLVIPGLADWCVIEVYDPDPLRRALIAAHVQPEKVELIRELRRRYSVDPSLPTRFWEDMRNFKSSLTSVLPDEVLAASAKDPEQLAFLRQLGMKSVIVTPMIANGKMFGTLTLIRATDEHPYTDDDLKLADELATRTALAVENGRLYEEAQHARHIAQQNADRLARYQSVLAALSEAISPAQVADVIVKRGTSALGAVAGSVAILNGDGTRLEMLSTTGYTAEVLDRWGDTPLSRPSPLTDVVRTGQPIWLHSIEEARARYPDITWDTLKDAHGAWAALPLTISGRVMGSIVLNFSTSQEFGADDRAFLVGMAQKCAQAWDRTHLATEIWEQREQFRVTLSSIGDAVIAADNQGRISFMNYVAQNLTRWSDSNGIGKPLSEVFHIINETTRNPVESPFVRVMREGGVIGLANHTLLVTRDGGELPIDDSGAPILDEQGHIKGVVLVFRDVTERRQQEVELDTTLQRTQDLYETCHHIGIVYEADEILRAQFTSRYLHHATQAAIIVFEDTLNGNKPDHYQVMALLDKDKAIPGVADDHATRGSPMIRLFSKTVPVFVNDTKNDPRIDPDQREIFEATQVRSLIIYPLTARGACFGMLVAYFTEPDLWTNDDQRHIQTFVEQISVALDNIRLLENEKQARREAEQANQLKVKFLAMISHELRTPLTSIKGFATTLLATDVEWDATSQHEFIGIINDEANKLTDLIEQILDLSRMQAGHLRIQPAPCSLDDLIEKAWPQLAVISTQHQLHLDCPSGFPPIQCDIVRIAQVLVNLVGNAAKYSPPGTLITVSCVAQDDSAQINVSDHGPGIPAGDRDKVFEAFSQLDNSESQRSKGAGLGLAICKGLIEAHRGRIWIASQSGPGTTVSFTIPFAQPELEQAS